MISLNSIKNKTIPAIIGISLLFGGCASFYRPIRPASINYNNIELDEKLTYYYKFDVLKESGNAKYVRKEERNDIRIVSVKLVNNTDLELDINNDIKFINENKEVYPLETLIVTNRIKQGVLGYILYSLIFVYYDNGYKRINIPVGLAIGLGNMISASLNNEKFALEFSHYNVVNKKIKPHEIFYGLVALRDIKVEKLEIKVAD